VEDVRDSSRGMERMVREVRRDRARAPLSGRDGGRWTQQLRQAGAAWGIAWRKALARGTRGRVEHNLG